MNRMQKVAIKILEKKLRQNALERRLVEASKVMPAFLPCKPRRGKPEPLKGAGECARVPDLSVNININNL